MFGYDNLLWSIAFPVTCAVMMWFSMALALLGRGRDAWCRRERARVFIEDSILLLLSREAHTTHEGNNNNNDDDEEECNDVTRREAMGKAAGGAASSQHVSHIANNTTTQHLTVSNKANTKSCVNNHNDNNNSSNNNARGTCEHGGLACSLTLPTAALRPTKAVIRRAVVVVGGDFARSPRMQHHAASLARCGLFDEIVLVGLNAGNALSEDLLGSGEATPMWFGLRAGRPCAVKAGKVRVVKHTSAAVRDGEGAGQRQEADKRPYSLGCEINTKYLISPPEPPSWLRWLAFGPLRWLVRTTYAVLSYTFTFTLLLLRTMAIRVNDEGQLLLTDLVLVQTPPAIPFILLLRYVARPLALVYNSIIYYGFIVPASWLYMDAMRDLRQECALHRDDKEDEAMRGEGDDLLASIERVRRERLHDILASSACNAQLARAARGLVFCPAILVDWHNLGYTIMQQAHRPRWSCALYRLLELGLCAGDVNLTVSEAMRTALRRLLWQMPAATSGASEGKEQQQAKREMSCGSETSAAKDIVVLYDKAPACFAPHSRRHFVQHILRHVTTGAQEGGGAAAGDTRRTAAEGSTNDEAQPLAAQHVTPGGGGGGGGSSNNGGDMWGIAPPPAWVYDTPDEADEAAEGSETQAAAAGGATHNARVTPRKGNNGSSSGNTNAPAPRNGLIVVGSTSWTEDDDYSVVIAALQRLDVRLTHIHRYLSYAQRHEARRRQGGAQEVGSPRTTAAASQQDSVRTSHSVSGTDTPSASYGTAEHGAAERMVDGHSGSDAEAEADFVVSVTDSGARGIRRMNSAAHWRRTENSAGAALPASEDAGSDRPEGGSAAPLPLWVLITGKGPARKRFEDAVRAARLSPHIVVSTLYLQSYADYIATLGAADVGLCLHFSSSGYDLPMKGVDMIGAGLPVIARRYGAIHELMGPDTAAAAQAHTDGGAVECERGWLFSTAEDLEEILAHLIGLHAPYWQEFVCTPGVAAKRRGAAGRRTSLLWTLAEARQAARALRAQTATWEQSWNATLLPVIHALT